MNPLLPEEEGTGVDVEPGAVETFAAAERAPQPPNSGGLSAVRSPQNWGLGGDLAEPANTLLPSQPADWSQEPAVDPELEYRALVKSLRRKRGFGLLFVQCSTAAGDELIQRVRQDISGKAMDVLRFEAPIADGNFLRRVEEYAATHGPVEILFVQGLHLSLLSYEEEQRAAGKLTADESRNYSEKGLPHLLINLNLGRERLREQFPWCFVFVLPQFAIKYLTRRAPDFFDWRSGVFELPSDRELVERESRRLLAYSSYSRYQDWTQDQRDCHHKELQAWLDEPHQSVEQRAQLLAEQGKLFLMSKKYELAIASYDAVLEIKPDDPGVWNDLGLALNDLERDEEALFSYEKALQYKPDSHAAWHNRGVVLGNLERYEDAIASYEKALQYKPSFFWAWRLRGDVLDKLGRYEEAISSYDAALQHKPDFYEAWCNRGNALDELGRYEDAIASYDVALRLEPGDHETWYNRGNALDKLERYEEAIISYDAALQYKSDLHEAWQNRGSALGKLERYEEAIASYEKALQYKPDLHEAWYSRGLALHNLGHQEAAITSYDQALQHKPNDYAAWCNRGLALNNLEHHEEAIASYDAALQYKPDLYEAWDNRGYLLSKLRRYEQAIASYDKALEIQPDHANAIYNKAYCLSLQGDSDGAIALLQQAIDLDSTYRKIAQTDSDFDALRGHPQFEALLQRETES